MAIVRVPTAKLRLIYKPLLEEADTNLINTSKTSTQIRGAITGGSTVDNTAGKIYNFGEPKELVIESNLINIQLSNGEGDRSNVIQVTFLDENFEIDRLFLNRALKAGGIEVPENLLKAPKQETDTPPGGLGAGSSGASAGSGASLLNISGDYTIPPDGTSGDKLATAIIKYCRAIGLTDNSWIASILGNITI